MLSIVELSVKEVLFAELKEQLSFSAQKDFAKNSILLVAMRSGDTPVPISNTMVKTWSADGTALETVWESRWPPDYKKENKQTVLDLIWNFGESLQSVKRLSGG